VTARIWPCVELQWGWLGGPLDERRATEKLFAPQDDQREREMAGAGAGR